MEVSIEVKFRRWLYYTVIVGALPLLVRLFTILIISPKDNFIDSIDVIFLALTLNLTNINELNSLKNEVNTKLAYAEDSSWWSIFIIVFLSLSLGLKYVGSSIGSTVVNEKSLLWISISFCVISLIHSGVIIYKLCKLK